MAIQRYDSRLVKACLRAVAGRDEHTVLVIADGAVPEEITASVASWLIHVRAVVLTGQRPDLSPVADSALFDTTPTTDRRWPVVAQHHASLVELGAVGRIRVSAGLLAPGAPPMMVTATQEISDGKHPHVRLNDQIRGVLWCYVTPTQIDVGWDLPADERDEASHITVLHGQVQGVAADLVFWDGVPSLIRAAPVEQLVTLIDKSIGVKELRDRWFRQNYYIEREDIRTELYFAERAGIHPAGRGSYIAERLLTARTKAAAMLPFSALAGAEGDVISLDKLAGFADSSDNPEELLLRSEDRAEAAKSWKALSDGAGADERLLIQALEDDFLAGYPLNFSATARRHGFDPAAAEAVKKRIRRNSPKNR